MLNKISSLFRKAKDTDPEQAYDLWAGSYDDQPDNLMLALDEEVFAFFLNCAGATGKRVIDVGCGTGRHWTKIMNQQPLRIEGYDVSGGMLDMLKQKFPGAVTHLLKGNLLEGSAGNGTDLLISTLTIAHIEDAAAALKEWNRVVKPGGDIIITDYHPAVLEKGGKRTFKQDDKTISVKNHIHSIAALKKIASGLNWETAGFIEKKIDDSVKHYYEKQNALPVFESFKGLPVIYGIHYKKQYDT